MVQADEVWNIVPLFILFREAIEAAIIVGVLISFVRRMNAKQLEKQIWWGVGMAATASIIFGIIFIVIYYEAQNNLFQGRNQFFFKGAVSWVASIMITVLAFALLRFMGWEAKWQRRLGQLAAEKARTDAAKEGKEVDPLNPTCAASAAGGPSCSLLPEVEGPAPAHPTTSTTFNERSKVSMDEESGSGALASPGSARLTKAFSSTERSSSVEEVGAAGARYPWYDPRRCFSALRSTPTADVTVDDSSLSWRTKYAFFLAVFLTVVREGLESMVFLAGVGNTKPTAIILPGLVGLICGILVGVLLYYTGKTVKNIKWLFIVMAMVLFFIAAGQAEMGADWLMKGGAFGEYMTGPLMPITDGAQQAFGDGDEVYSATVIEDGYGNIDLRPWWMRPLWDVSGCCPDTDEGNKFLALCKAIFGYNAQPCFVDVIAYCGYWVLAILIACWKFHRGTLFDADYKHNKMLRKQAEAAAAAREEEAALARAKGVDVSEVVVVEKQQ